MLPKIRQQRHAGSKIAALMNRGELIEVNQSSSLVLYCIRTRKFKKKRICLSVCLSTSGMASPLWRCARLLCKSPASLCSHRRSHSLAGLRAAISTDSGLSSDAAVAILPGMSVILSRFAAVFPEEV